MTKIKKVVALALAFLMIFSSASVLANAWTVTVDDGFNLAIGTKFFINDGTEWVETEKVAPGDNVKARVYIGTDYYSNSSTLLFFYDKDFFTHGYNGISDISVNPEVGAFTGKLNPAPVLTSQVNAGYIDSAFLDEYAAISVNLFMPSGSTNAMYDDSTWIFEFDLTIAETATGEGDLFVKDTTVQNSTSQNKALVNVPKGPEGGTNADVWPMWRWNANVTLTSQPVSVDGSVTFNANSGKFADGTDKAVVNGIISKEYEVPANPTRDGYTFIGWIDATDTTPTYEEAQATVLVDAIPYEPVAYNAYWIKNVNITFNTDGGTEIAAHENVTPYTEFAAVEAPTKSGYTFVGWDVRGNMTLPETYPDVNTTYTAIWAKDVIVSFNTNGAAAIESIEGVAGEAFEAEIANPSKEGHRFVKWSPALPTVFPEADTTYKAIFEANIYPVYYYVDGVRVLNALVEYGMEIPDSIGTAVPEGMTLSAWYTDEEMTQEFVAGTTMGTQAVSLYAKYENKTYNAIFDANGGKFADGNATVSVPTVYLDDIVAPAAPTKAGYEFAGWTPLADGTSFDEANDMYFYATWVELERTVEYYANGSLYETFNLNTGDEFDVPADAYKEGYSFLYWSETEGGAEATLPATMPELETAEPLKYYAVFEINEYTITWNVDGVETEATYKYDEVIVAVDNPAKTGYTFAGWDGYTDGMKMPAEDVTATAKWTIETYTLKFDTVGGNTIGDITADYGTDITVPADPTKEGHTFTGWSDTIPTVMPDLGENGATKTFTASWSVNDYTVTWIVDGVEDTDTYAYGAAITAPVPTKTGYVFAGWDAEVPATMPAENLTFTGSWNPATDTKYTVNIHTMDVDGNYVTSTEELTGTTDSTVYAQYTVEEGFELGANSKTEGVVAADGSLVLDVYLNRKTATISFNTDGGSAVNAINGLYGAAVNVTEETTKKGYDFAGWENLPATFPAADAEVKALWTAKTYNATFDAAGGQFEGGAATAVVPTVFNEAIAVPAAPTMKGHDFAGWTPEVGSMTEEGMIFTAVWTKNTYDATFIVDGEVYDTKPTVFGEAIELPAVPTKPGYVFSTWTPAVGNMTEEGMTFTAEWINATDTKYTVTVYTMNTDGTYGEGVISTYAGETGAEAKAEGKYTISEGFKLSEVKENVLSGTIAADGSLALVVYIDRIEYTFTVNVDGATTSTNYLYGATVAAPETPVKDGYTFSAWTPEVPATMPAENVEVVAGWTKNTNTAYKVIVNYTDAKTGEAVATEENYTGTTENAIEIVEAKGNAENTEYVLLSDLIPTHYQLDTSAANQLTGTVAADGSTVLNIYLVPVKYTATFTTGEGAFADGSTSYEVELDYYSLVSDYAPAEVPTREGYSFDSWRNADTTHIAADREFPAKWNIESYTIILDAAGGTVSPESITADFGAAINPVADPVKEGHSFTGWSEAIPSTMPDLGDNGATKTITATWSKNSYTVTWVVPGQEDQVDTVVYGDAITAPVPTKTGYVFAGWDAEVPATMPANNLTFTGSWNPATDTKYTVNIHTMDVDGNYVTATEELTGTTDSTVYAQYTVEEGFELGANSKTEGVVAADGSLVLDVYLNRKTVTISFNTDGGSAVEALTGLYGATVGTPATTTKTGYTFDGWANLPATFPAADTTATAQWKINSYTITFNAGEGTFADGSKEKTVEFDYNETPVAPETPAKVGYGFTNWSPDFAPVTGDATYTAQYAAGAVSYKVETYTMDTEGNYGAPATETKGGTADTTATYAPAEKTGFTVDADASVLEGTIVADGSLVLKVYYIRNQYDFTVTVDDESTTTKYYYEATVAAPSTPTKEGHTFAAWDKAVPATMPAENYEVKATWTVDNFTVTWIVDGVEDTDTYAYGAAITAPVPTKTGYVFAGWDAEVPATMPAENLTFTGSWNPATDTKYTVNIHTMGTDGQYTVATEELTGTTDSTVYAQYTVEEGFELGANSKTEGVVAADGSLVLDVYLNRKTVTISFNTDGGSAVEALTGLYGATVGTPAATTKEGHDFAGWANLPATFPAADTTATAQWSVLSYELVYRTNSGNYETYSVAYGTAAADMPVPAVNPEWTGHTFTGWSELPATMPAERVTVTAGWDLESYTINFNADGGEVTPASITADYNAAITLPTPTKTGYVFNGWVDAEGNSVTAAKMPDLGDNGAVVTYTATWANATDTAYTVEIYTMNAEGGYDVATSTKYGETGAPVSAEYTVENGFELGADSVTSGTIAADGSTVLKVYLNRKSYTLTVNVDDKTTTSTVLYGAAISVDDPSKEGHTFTGWTPALPATMPANDVEVTATWSVDNYTVTWIVDGKETVETYAYGAAITAPVPTKAGYVFAGWDATVPATMPAENLTFTGSWVNATDTKYTVTIKTMNTDGTYSESTNTYTGETGAPVKAEYTIEEGFSLNAASVTEGNILADSSLALVVIIDRNEYTFTVDVDGDVTSTKYLYGATVAAPATPVKEGYTFAAWDAEVPATMPAKDVTVKATWTVNAHTITWIVDGVEDVDDYNYGDAITAPVPTKTGYVFAGWDAEVPATMPDADLTFTGSWNPATDTKYTVNIHTMDVDGNYAVATEELTGTTDSTVYAQYTVEEGFELGANSVTEGKVAADGSLVLDVYLNRKTFTITFAETGNEAIAPITGLYGTTVKAPADPAKTGYTFTGWDKPIPGTLTKDETITATWNINSYTVTWIVDGETKAINGYEYGAAITSLEAPSKDGYVFAGWAWTNEDGETVAAPTAMPAYNVTATATWANATDTAYTVEIYTMNAEGGYDVATSTKYGETGAPVSAEYTVEEGFELGADSVTSGTIAADGSTVLKVYLNRKSYILTVNVDDKTTTSTVLYGAAVSVDEPSKEGYDFAGWDNEVPATMPAKDVTLTAQWTVLQYTVTFVVDGVEDVKTLDYGAAIEATKPAKEGYRFVGWADETGALATVPATMPAKNLKFTAVFETLTYIVYYYVDGALVDTLSGEYGDTIATTGSYSVPVGYELDGWYTDAACETKLADGATIGAASTNLYAKTVAKMYDAIFMVDGEVYETVSTAFDSEIIAPEDPAKEGYVFTGWTPVVGIMDTEGATFTATWKEGDYSVTYKAEGMKDEVFGLMFGEELEVPADPYKEGYTFKYWSLTEGGEEAQLPATMPAENLVYYAVFEINEYTVTWVIDGVETVDTVKYGAAITAPATDKEGFSFLGWSLTADGEIVEIATVMGAENLKYYAVYEADAPAIPIKLMPYDSETGVIERNIDGEQFIESYNDDSADPELVYENFDEDYEKYYVYGFTGRSFSEDDVWDYFYVQGNGSMDLEYSELSDEYGTGAKIIVTDNDTGDIVEEFYVIIFGDVNGDAVIDAADSSEVEQQLVQRTWSSGRRGVPYRIKAADLDLTEEIDANDSAAFVSLLVKTVKIDQTTGMAELR